VLTAQQTALKQPQKRSGPPAIPSLSMEEVQRTKEEEGARGTAGCASSLGGGIEALLSSRKSKIAVEMEREWMHAVDKDLKAEAQEDLEEEALFRGEVDQLWDEMVDVLRKTWVPKSNAKDNAEVCVFVFV
jgi:hypothetical protein